MNSTALVVAALLVVLLAGVYVLWLMVPILYGLPWVPIGLLGASAGRYSWRASVRERSCTILAPGMGEYWTSPAESSGQGL